MNINKKNALNKLTGNSMGDSPVRSANTEEVIVIEITVGEGIESHPYQLVKEYWTTDGKLIGVIAV